MEKIKDFYESVGYYKAMGQVLSLVVDNQECSVEDFILKFELNVKEFRKYVDVSEYSTIDNDFHNWNEAAQEMWVSEKYTSEED